ncbi:MAG: ferredoxin [Actinobacteria bacterium]|nr:ferredoxin [Actinomycetota bacterium]
MRLKLDNNLCQGHGRCYTLAPELFDSDDDGYSVLTWTDDVPDELAHSARLAVENCPENAITFVETDGD